MTSFLNSSPLQVSQVLTDKLPKDLSTSSKTLFKALVAVSVETAKAKGYSSSISHMTLHLPLEVLASVCGIHRSTAWRNLKVLKELGVVDARAHKGTLRGETRNTGMVFQVRLNPLAGSKCRLSFDDLKHKWRDLQKDVFAKRTAYKQVRDRVQQSEENPRELDIDALLQWTLFPKQSQPPLEGSLDCRTSKGDALFALLDLKNSPKEERNKTVELAAQALAMALADSKSISFYQLLLWNLLRGYSMGQDYFQAVYNVLQRVLVDSQEGFARKSGALLIARLKEAGLFEPIMGVPKIRVGTSP